MTTAVQDVFERALALSEAEQLELLRMLSSAVEPAGEQEDEWDDAYVAELDEIEAQIEAGTMRTYTHDEIREFVRQKLARVD